MKKLRVQSLVLQKNLFLILWLSVMVYTHNLQVLGRLRQGDHMFEASLENLARDSLSQNEVLKRARECSSGAEDFPNVCEALKSIPRTIKK